MKIHAMYFSPTETTKKVVETISGNLSRVLNGNQDWNTIDFTPKAVRDQKVSFGEDDLVVLGVPVIAGRVPNVLLNYLNSVAGNGAKAICVVNYGNRNFDDALIELRDIMENDGFHVAAAGAFIGEHSFSRTLAKNRPDEKDLGIAEQFAERIAAKIKGGYPEEILTVKGYEPYRKYYMPKDKEGNPVDIRKVTPKTNEDCTKCLLCAEICPMGSIDREDPSKLNGICIKCGACIKKCPVSAKYYDDPDYLRHQYELEEQFAARREPELFL